MFAFTSLLMFPNSMYLPQNYVLPRSVHSTCSNIKQFTCGFVFVFQRANSKLSFYIVALCVVVPCSLVARYQRMNRKYPQNFVRVIPSLCCYAPAVPLPRRQSWQPQIMCACVHTFVFFPKRPDQIRSPLTGDPFPQG